MNRTSATETVALGSIPSRVKPNTVKIGLHRFPARRHGWKEQCEASTVFGKRVGKLGTGTLTRRQKGPFTDWLLAKTTWWNEDVIIMFSMPQLQPNFVGEKQFSISYFLFLNCKS